MQIKEGIGEKGIWDYRVIQWIEFPWGIRSGDSSQGEGNGSVLFAKKTGKGFLAKRRDQDKYWRQIILAFLFHLFIYLFGTKRSHGKRQGEKDEQERVRNSCWVKLRDKLRKITLVCVRLWNIKLKNAIFILCTTENALGCSTCIPQHTIKLKGTPCNYSAVLVEDGGDGVIFESPNLPSYCPYYN